MSLCFTYALLLHDKLYDTGGSNIPLPHTFLGVYCNMTSNLLCICKAIEAFKKASPCSTRWKMFCWFWHACINPRTCKLLKNHGQCNVIIRANSAIIFEVYKSIKRTFCDPIEWLETQMELYLIRRTRNIVGES